MGRIRIHIGCAPVSFKKANNNLKNKPMVELTRPLSVVHNAKVRLFEKTTKRKTLNSMGSFPIYCRKIPLCLSFSMECCNFATMKRYLFIVLYVWLAVTGVMAQSNGFSVDTLSNEIFARMRGRSYPANCPIPRSELRYLQVLHYDFEGQVHKGEMVCNYRIANDLIDIFQKLYNARYPIERIRLIDDYDADDERSMADNNTSCFCFRHITGSKHLSKHAQGLAVDINALYNPYVKTRKDGSVVVQPAKGKPYANRQKKFRYKIVKGDLCYRLFIEHGFKWGGNWRSLKDYQHFEF